MKIGEKLEVSAAAYFDGRTAVYLHRRASDLRRRWECWSSTRDLTSL